MIIPHIKIKENYFFLTIYSLSTTKYTISLKNKLDRNSTKEKSYLKFSPSFILIRIPYTFDIEKVPDYLSKDLSSYEDYLNDLKNHTYF